MTSHKTIILSPKKAGARGAARPGSSPTKSGWMRPQRRSRPARSSMWRGDDGRVFGTGYFNPKSLIAVRLLDRAGDVTSSSRSFSRATAEARAGAARSALRANPLSPGPCRRRRSAGPHDRPLRRHASSLQITHGRAWKRCSIRCWPRSTKTLAPAQRHPARRRAVARAGRSGLVCPRGEGRSRAHRRGRKRRALFRRSRPRARRPAGITTSATIAPSWPRLPRANRCSTLIATPAALASGGRARRREGSRRAWIQFGAGPGAGRGQRRGQRRQVQVRQGRCVRRTGAAVGGAREIRHRASPIRRPS